MQEVIVCDQVKFSLEKVSGKSQIILLPWAPAVYQEIGLKATGGGWLFICPFSEIKNYYYYY